jgi:hypothetical protein
LNTIQAEAVHDFRERLLFWLFSGPTLNFAEQGVVSDGFVKRTYLPLANLSR